MEINFKKTGESKELYIGGETKIHDVFLVPLKDIVYNVNNGRIASYTYGLHTKSFDDVTPELNNSIHSYIIQSEPNKFNITKKDIEKKGQEEPAVILKTQKNYIVIDGNRRFTALRALSEEYGEKFSYLKAFIIDAARYSHKEIKAFEVRIQHGKDEKVDYNPIDSLVDSWVAIVKNQIFTIKEYATEKNVSQSKIREDIDAAETMIRYLEFIGEPEDFQLARKQKIDGPIREIPKVLKSKKIEKFQKPYVEQALFHNIYLSSSGDLTREVRALKALFEEPRHLKKYRERTSKIFQDSSIILQSQEKVSPEIYLNLSNSLQNINRDAIYEKDLSKARALPKELLQIALARLDELDTDVIKYMSKDKQQQLLTLVLKLDEKISEIKVQFSNEDIYNEHITSE